MDESIQKKLAAVLPEPVKDAPKEPDWWVWKYPDGSYCPLCLDVRGQSRKQCLAWHKYDSQTNNGTAVRVSKHLP